ncbi:MAG: NAD(P)/FAD-dependent oxidoreductase [Oscillospiraceae bacterium]
MNEVLDCIVLGAGPAGLSAGVNLAQRAKKVLLLSSGDNLLKRAERVDNYLGLPGVSGKEMMDIFTNHAKAQGVEIRSGVCANIYPSGNEFMVNFAGDILNSRSVIIACGVAKAQPVQGETELLGNGVSYCATCDGMLYRGKEIAVWGLCTEAVHEANYLCEIGCKVNYISTAFTEGLNADIKHIDGRVSAIEKAENILRITIGETAITVSGIFILRNAIAPSALLTGLELENGFIKVNAKGETNIKGVYAAGDVTGKPLQVANAVGDGLVAALNVAEYLDLAK